MKAFRNLTICILSFVAFSLVAAPRPVLADPPMNGPMVHIVRWGENLTRISVRYGVSVYDIAQANRLADPNHIYVGQRLVIPLPPAPAPALSGDAIQYTVQTADTLSALSVRYRSTVHAIVQANKLVNPHYIYVGQVLVIPTEGGAIPTTGVYYTVRAGDTLAGIAYRYGVSYWPIVQANNLSNPSLIYVGQVLFVPGGIAPAEAPTVTPTVAPSGTVTATATQAAGTTPAATAVAGATAAPTPTVDPDSCTPGAATPEATPYPECQLPPATVIPPGPVPLPTPWPPKSLYMNTPEYGMIVNVWGMGNCITDRDLALVKEAGFTWVKQPFRWRDIEVRRGQYDWSEADRVVAMVAKYGLDLAISVSHQPEWAGGGYPLNGPPRNMAHFASFMGELARRYKGLVRAYEIWPGPNVSENWGGQSPDVDRYAEMLIDAYWYVKEQDPFAMIISGGLVQTAVWDGTSVPPLEYFKMLYETDVKGACDVWGVQALGFLAAPENTPEDLASPHLNGNFPATKDRNMTWGFRSIEVLHDWTMPPDKPIKKQWVVTKMGWTTETNERSRVYWAAVSEDVKADHLRRAYWWAKDNWSDWVGVMFVPLTNARLTTNDEDYGWSVVEPDGCPRKSYYVLKEMGK
jgi:LysM repeat protein